MDHAETSPDQVAKTVFWIIVAGSLAFIAGVLHSNPVAGASMLERYLTAASTYAHSIDHLFILIAVMVGFWLIVAEGMMFLAGLQVSGQGRAPNAVHHRGRTASEAMDFDSALPGHRVRHRHPRRRDHGLVQHQASHASRRRDRARHRPAMGLELPAAGPGRSPGYRR